MKEFLEKYEDIDVVISENDNMTFGAIEAIREAGRTIGSDGDIIILSFDAVRDALKAIQTGDIAADFECNPLTAPLVEETIRRLEAGESVEKIQYVEETYFDCEMDLGAVGEQTILGRKSLLLLSVKLSEKISTHLLTVLTTGAIT